MPLLKGSKEESKLKAPKEGKLEDKSAVVLKKLLKPNSEESNKGTRAELDNVAKAEGSDKEGNRLAGMLLKAANKALLEAKKVPEIANEDNIAVEGNNEESGIELLSAKAKGTEEDKAVLALKL